MLRPTYKEKGTTTSEKYLSHLCEQCFFGLWSYPNLYTDESNKGGNTTGKELCDLLVVFGNDIVIFSDKMITYKKTEDVKIGWTRWYKKAIKQSASQIYGAERWVKEYPDRIYHDKFCKDKFVLELPYPNLMRIHRVVITSNISKDCSEFYGSGSTGTFVLSPMIKDDENYLFPFSVGNVNSHKGFVHIFNELSISMVLGELDTVGDFLDYIKKREVLFSSGNVLNVEGEEELLGYYLQNHYDYMDEIPDVVSKHKNLSGYGLVLKENTWSQYLDSQEYNNIKQIRSQSYMWDELIKRFDAAILSGDVAEWTGDHVYSHERAMRMLARERRAYRQVLARNLAEKIIAVKGNERSVRLVPSVIYPDCCFLFLVYGRDLVEDVDSNRSERIGFLNGYCFVTKLIKPNIRYVIGVATEQLSSVGRSEDVLVLDFNYWTEKDEEYASKIQQEHSILKNMKNMESSKDQILKEMFPWVEINTSTKKLKIGRNDPCSCGSGKKYKKCCGF